MFSQDSDMLREARRRLQTGSTFAGLAYADQLGITIGQAVESLELLAKASHLDQVAGRVEYLPL